MRLTLILEDGDNSVSKKVFISEADKDETFPKADADINDLVNIMLEEINNKDDLQND